jgi:hypothetical protein
MWRASKLQVDEIDAAERLQRIDCGGLPATGLPSGRVCMGTDEHPRAEPGHGSILGSSRTMRESKEGIISQRLNTSSFGLRVGLTFGERR